MQTANSFLDLFQQFVPQISYIDTVLNSGLFKGIFKPNVHMTNMTPEQLQRMTMVSTYYRNWESVCSSRSMAERLLALGENLTGQHWSYLITKGIGPTAMTFISQVLGRLSLIDTPYQACLGSNILDISTGIEKFSITRLDPDRERKSRKTKEEITTQTFSDKNPGFSGSDVSIYIYGDAIDSYGSEYAKKAKYANAQIDAANKMVGGITPSLGPIASINEYSLPMVKIGNAVGINFSGFRAKPGARPLGTVNPAGHARGTRTVAGTLTSTILSAGLLAGFIMEMDLIGNTQEDAFICLDQVPPFNLVITFNNEYGMGSFRLLKGVEFISEDFNTDIGAQQLYETVQFIAATATPILPVTWETAAADNTERLQEQVMTIDKSYFNKVTGNSISDLKYEDIFTKYKDGFDHLNWSYK